jgi:alkylated DNA nucleotide flippase Atl1
MLTFLEKLKAAPDASFHVLDPIKAERMKAKTLFIPSPKEVATVIAAIPEGQTRTIVEVRQELAWLGNAETACPAKTIAYWKWLAHAYDEAQVHAPHFAVPWWRVLKDGKPSRHLPGGVEGQLALLAREKL